MDIDSLDFSGMMCDVTVLQPKQNPLEVFDFFKKHREFHVPIMGLSKVKVLKYIALVYDKKSPLHEKYKELPRVKIAACEIANFVKGENGKFGENVERMMNNEFSEINAMIIRYVTGFFSAKYQRWVIFNELYTRESINLINGKTKIDDFKKISQELEDAEADLLSGDALLHVDLSKYYFEDKLELRPEDIAIRLSKGEVPVEIAE